MDLSNLPPPHGGVPLGEQWFRGLAKPAEFLTAMREDFFIMVVGCMMKYIRLEKSETGLTYKARIVKQFNHGVDGVAYICGCPYRDVYAMAEKRLKPRIFMFQIQKSDKGELEPHYLHSLRRIHSWDIRSMQFLSKELLVILTGIPTFNVVLFRWNTNEELMVSQAVEPNLFSKLLVNPSNTCQWMEYGTDYMFVYEMPSLTRTDVIRTKINLPKRQVLYDHPDPQMGRPLATKIVSACWTNIGDFFILDERLGIHKYIPETKVLQWTCSLTQTFLGPQVAQIVPFEASIAAITRDGWFLQYGEIALGGNLEVIMAFKLSSNVVRYISFPENPETFFAITESKGMVEGVTQGLLRDPFAIPDLMFSNILSCCFVEPQADYMVIVTKFGKCVVLECETGAPIAKWKLPFKVAGVISHPVLPFLFCGTDYGCVNVLDIRNLKTPKLINRRFFTREPDPWIDKFGFVSQGRYLISADTSNNRIFVQYGYPFMSFDFIDTAKVPARISYISAPGCGKDDNRFQVYMSGKSPSDGDVVAFVINFSLRNDRLMVVASQSVDQPVTAMCFAPIPKSLYAWFPIKKALGVVPYCDDNQWLNLQEPEYLIENKIRFDVHFMVFHGTRLYTFHEDGSVQYHVAPVLPKKKQQLPMVLETLGRIQTHTYSDCGVRDGVVSFDGSQVVAIGHDGTFCRIRFFPKPPEPEWQVLGYDRPKLIDYQVGTYLIDQEFHKAGEPFVDRISDIKVKIDQPDPMTFQDETETEDEEETIPQETPKGTTVGEKFKYGPKRSFKGTVTRTKKAKSVKLQSETLPDISQPTSTATEEQQKSSSGSDKTSKKRVTISQSALMSTLAGLESEEEGERETKANDTSLQETTEEMSEVPTDPVSDKRGSRKQSRVSDPGGEKRTSISSARKSKGKKSEAGGRPDEDDTVTDSVKPDSNSTGSSDDPPKLDDMKAKQKSLYKERLSQRLSRLAESQQEEAELLMKAGVGVTETKSTVEQLPAAIALHEQAAETSVLQKLLSKVQEATPEIHLEAKPEDASLSITKSPPKDSAEQGQEEAGAQKTATTAALTSKAPTGAALKNVLTERLKRKQMAKVKSAGKHEHRKSKHDIGKAFQKPDAEQTATTTDTEGGGGQKEDSTATPDETTTDAKDEEEEEEEEQDEAAEETSAAEEKFKKGLKGLKALKTAKILSTLFGKGKKKDQKKEGAKKKKIKKFQGGQAGKMLQEATQAPSKVKAPASKTARGRMGQAKIMKQMIEEEKMESQQVQKKRKHGKRRSRAVPGGEQATGLTMVEHLRKKKDQQSEASRALLIEAEMSKNIETSVLRDPAIYLLPEKLAKPYEGLDVEDVLTVDHIVRRKEFTEAEFFAQYEKTLLYRQHVPKAQALRREFVRFTELMEELMFFNRQREEGNQVEMKEFNFDEDREGRLREKSDKMKRLANIQMVVRNKLRHARINAMKFLVWEQYETKGMTLMGFRKKLEVSNYPLLPESQFYEGAVTEAISWRRLEQRLELEEEDCLKDANQHALRVLTHEMQFMSPAKKRLYMKSIMAIDPTIRFDDYEASDSDKSDNEFFSKVFEELGIDLPDDGKGDGLQGAKSETAKDKTAIVVGAALTASKAASKFLDKRKKYTESQRKSDAAGYVEKLKKLLLEEQEREEQLEMLKANSQETSVAPSEMDIKEQSRRDFMVNIKPSKAYYHPKGIFGPKGSKTEAQGPRRDNEFEVLMDPAVGKDGKPVSEVASGVNKGEGGAPVTAQASKKRFKAVVKQKKKMKFQRRPDVVFDEEEDLSEPEDQAVTEVQQKKFDAMDDDFKERFDTVNNIFFGSSLSELTDMYQFKPANFRYSQFDMGSRHEFWRHHLLIVSEIYQLKKFFNRQFELLRNSKQYCLRKMSDRNERIREIYYYLKVDLDILDEKWRLQEDPSQIFTVTKDELPVERYLTAEQRKLEEQRRLEDLARRRTRMAEFRKKALYIMMDNRLEVKREEILVNDIPKPNFMLEKDPLEFTLEEYLQSLQYAEAVEALEKARVDMIKELEEELGRLYRANAMDINTIDLRVTELALMKFQFHQNFQMEETRILRAIRQLRMMEELDKEERRIAKIVNELKSSMKSSQHMVAQLEAKKTACEEEIAKFAEQEKDLERNFRRDLGDVGQYFEFFFKNYKKKPKLSLKGLNKSEVYETMVRALRSDNIRSFAKDNGETGRIVVMAIYDMEDPMLMPKDCPRSYWDRFNRVRRERLVCDYQTKTLLAEIDRITEGINECLKKEADGTAAIAAVLGVLSHKNDLKNYFVANIEFQMVLGKGQCEIDCWDFDQHINANIILIQNVEKLNSSIFDASEKLIKEMTRTAAVHRDIKEVEWRFLVVEMATKDLKKVRHDVGCFKPKKKLLEILRKGVNLDSMYSDRIALVDYLRITYIKYQSIFLRTKRRLLMFYKNQTTRKQENNELYKEDIFEQTELLVADQVNKVTPGMTKQNKTDTEKRAVQLMLQGYLQRKIIRICNEVEKLEEELEKQYKRTYPVL